MSLLRVRTPHWELEIRGPHAPPAGVMAGVETDRPGLLRFAGSVDDLTCDYLDQQGEAQTWDSEESVGPLLFEDTSYHLYVAGVDNAPSVVHRDPLFGRDLSAHPRQRVVSGTFNLGRQVGETSFDILVDGHSVGITLEVVPTKIDYATDYRALVEEVRATSRSLALAFLRSTHQSAAHSSSQRATALEWIASLTACAEDVTQAVHQINQRPYRHLLRRVEPESSHRLRRPDAVARRSIMRGKGSGRFDQVEGVGPVREKVPAVVARTTLDTPEHRWIADQLLSVAQRLQLMARGLRESTRSDSTSARERARLEEVLSLGRQMQVLARIDVLAGVSRLSQASSPSLTLLSAPGYRECYRALSSLRLALELDGDAMALELKDLHDLYEIWCFLEVVAITSRVTGAEPHAEAAISSGAGGLKITLRQGQRSDITFRGEDRALTLSYNRTYNGDTGSHRPDIVIVVHSEDRPELVIALDAKYRVDASPAFRSRHGAPGPPVDAVNELHRYRDAIVSDFDRQLYRPTVRGAALFPLTENETPGYVERSSLYRSLGSLGIGALPFLPGNTALVEAWLTTVLGLSNDELEWNGPPAPATLESTSPQVHDTP